MDMILISKEDASANVVMGKFMVDKMRLMS